MVTSRRPSTDSSKQMEDGESGSAASTPEQESKEESDSDEAPQPADGSDTSPATRQPVLVVHGDREHLVRPGEEFGSDLGILEVPTDVEPGATLETHLGTEFRVRRLRGPDQFHHFTRTGAPMVPRDVGLIIGETGIGVGDRVLDAGTGTGVLAASMANAGATVVTYERDPEFADVARENMAMGGLEDAVDVRTGNLLEELDALEAEAPFDVVTLDTGDAPELVERVPAVLVEGGFVAVYSPFVETAKAATKAAREAGLSDIFVRETIQREMQFDDRGSRPSTAPVGHTGYLLFARLV